MRAAVRSGALVPGELYSVYRLAEELGVSRSPVREALLRLAETGMVKFERNRGFRLVLPAAEDIAEIFSIRLALEVQAVRHATLISDDDDRRLLREQYTAMEKAAAVDDESAYIRFDQHFHALLLDFDGNSRTKSIINNLRDATRMVGPSTLDSDRSLDEVLVEHLPIVEAFETGEAEAAARAVEHHLRTTGRLLLARALLHEGKPEDEDKLWSRLIGS